MYLVFCPKNAQNTFDVDQVMPLLIKWKYFKSLPQWNLMHMCQDNKLLPFPVYQIFLYF